MRQDERNEDEQGIPWIREDIVIRLSPEEQMFLATALGKYQEWFRQHREEDGGKSHPEVDWRAFQDRVSDLTRRLISHGPKRP
jgi:hypothetical protein